MAVQSVQNWIVAWWVKIDVDQQKGIVLSFDVGELKGWTLVS